MNKTSRLVTAVAAAVVVAGGTITGFALSGSIQPIQTSSEVSSVISSESISGTVSETVSSDVLSSTIESSNTEKEESQPAESSEPAQSSQADTSSTNVEQPENSAPAEQPKEASAPADSASQVDSQSASSEQSKYIYPIIDPKTALFIYPDEPRYNYYCNLLNGDAGVVPTANSYSCYKAYWNAVHNCGASGITVGLNQRTGERLIFDIPGITDAPTSTSSPK